MIIILLLQITILNTSNLLKYFYLIQIIFKQVYLSIDGNITPRPTLIGSGPGSNGNDGILYTP